MSDATERVAEFLRQWAMMRDKTDLIYGVLADPDKDETADLLASDLHDLLNDLEQFEQIFTGRADAAVVMLKGSEFEASAPDDTEVRFWMTDETDDYIAVRLEDDQVHVRSAGRGRALVVHPTSTTTLDLALRRSY